LGAKQSGIEAVTFDPLKSRASRRRSFYFFPVGEDILAIFTDWAAFLQKERLWGLDDPLFPATRIAFGVSRNFEVAGLGRKCWAIATPIRTIFRAAFEGAGLPYFNPHSFRKTLALFGQEVSRLRRNSRLGRKTLGMKTS
jgi:integrase